MEHRLSERVDIPVRILIYHNGVPVISSESRDLSLDGMFVGTGEIKYNKNTRIDVEFSVSDKASTKRVRLPAIIVHQSKRGFGLMFTGMDRSGYKALQKLIQTWKTLHAKNKKEHDLVTGEHPELWYQ